MTVFMTQNDISCLGPSQVLEPLFLCIASFFLKNNTSGVQLPVSSFPVFNFKGSRSKSESPLIRCLPYMRHQTGVLAGSFRIWDDLISIKMLIKISTYVFSILVLSFRHSDPARLKSIRCETEKFVKRH